MTIHDDELSEADEQFGIEVCTDFETNSICFMTVVTIIDNDGELCDIFSKLHKLNLLC